MGKVELIKDRCIGCGACMSIAPENFTFGDDGRAEMINSELTNEAIDIAKTYNEKGEFLRNLAIYIQTRNK